MRCEFCRAVFQKPAPHDHLPDRSKTTKQYLNLVYLECIAMLENQIITRVKILQLARHHLDGCGQFLLVQPMITLTNERDRCLSCWTRQIAASNDTFRATQSNGLAKELLHPKNIKFYFCFSLLKYVPIPKVRDLQPYISIRIKYCGFTFILVDSRGFGFSGEFVHSINSLAFQCSPEN
jgi:hypothetical protein